MGMNRWVIITVHFDDPAISSEQFAHV